MPVFEGFQVVAGMNGLDREVSTVSVMDAPDIYAWMKGGEFLITSAYVVKDSPDYIATLISKLDEWGASAFGIKFGRFIEKLPEQARKVAEELNFPIIAIPIEFAFTEVINPVLNEIINSQAKKMKFSENVHSALTNMVLEGADASTILSILEQYIHSETAFVSFIPRQAIYPERTALSSSLHADILALQQDSLSLEALLAKYEYYRLYINEETYGYLLFGEKWDSYEKSFEDYYRIAIEQAGIVLILLAQKQLAQMQIERNYREQFIQDLLRASFDSRSELNNRARTYNWNFDQGAFVAIVDVDNFKKQYLSDLDTEKNRHLLNTMDRILNICLEIIKPQFEQVVYSLLSDQLVLIISDCRFQVKKIRETREIFELVCREIKRREGFTATIGIGNYQDDISNISKSLHEAKKSVQIAKQMHKNDLVSIYEELGSLKIFALVSDSPEANEFYEMYIGKLARYDEKHNTALIDTLLAIRSSNWNLKKASEKMFIHYNTIKYRYQRICEILNIDLKDREKRLDVEIALKLLDTRPTQ